jgi:serine/threonine-protein kinase
LGLTQKILLFTGLLVVALVGSTVAFTSRQADRLATAAIDEGLSETRQAWQTYQADRFNKLKLGVRVLANDPAFKSLVELNDPVTLLDTLRERLGEINADFYLATDPAGVVVARTDRPADQGRDLAQDPLVRKPLEGEEAATIWSHEDRLFHAVSVPMLVGPDLKGVLIAGYGIGEQLASDLRKLTHSEIAFVAHPGAQAPRLVVSTLGPREGSLRDEQGPPFALALGGDRHVGVRVPLTAATGEAVGSLVALRSMSAETAAFRSFRTSLIGVSLVVMVAGLLVAWLSARGITGPVRRLVGRVERARDGRYAGAVAVDTSDEIGVLARAFNNLLSDLREKEQMIGFLKEGMTLLKKGSGVTGDGSLTDAPTLSLESSPVPGAPPVEEGSTFGGRYVILGKLGMGGTGVVFRARDQKLDEVVAVKVVRTELLREDPQLLDRFKQEIKLARRITHRNVLRTHDFGETGGTPYISMEYLEGVTLKDLIRHRGALPLAVGLSVAKQACQGLEAAHEVGVVHRDVKPQNMLILPETGELKIMDFGIARVSDMKGRGMTTVGMVMGTPDYMPPEQAQGRPADFRSDIYSLGIVLYEIFSGALPFPEDTPVATIIAQVQKTPARPRSVNPAVPADLEAVILRCIEKDPAKRYQTVGALKDALSAVSARLEASAA